MPESFRVAAITDEFSPDLQTALRSMTEVGMTGAELRMVFGKNILDLSDEELEAAIAMVRDHGHEIVSIASPLLKCVLPDSPTVDERFQQDMFASRHTFADQPALTARAFEVAERTGARIIRVFSYWRTIRPMECFTRIVDALGALADQARERGMVIGLENEHACNIATGKETAAVLGALEHPALKVVWDPANALISGEKAYPDGYREIAPERIAHVHAKDCTVEGHRPIWGPLGEGWVGWKDQVAALAADGYRGWLSLETHWPGPDGDKLQASIICGRTLKSLAAAG